jgi:hypothetical protein
MSHYQTDRQGKPIQATFAWIIALLTFGYMLPWAIAASRGKSNAGVIGWVNLLVGWSLIGWIVALAMAAGSHQVVAVSQPIYVSQGMNQALPYQAQQAIPGHQAAAITSAAVAPPGWYIQADGTQRWWDGSAWAPQVPLAPPIPVQVTLPVHDTVVVPWQQTIAEPVHDTVVLQTPPAGPVVQDAVIVEDGPDQA